MKDKTYRKERAQEVAREKLRELRGKGLSDAAIGRHLGGSRPISGVFIARLLRDEEPAPVSKRIWDALVEKEGVTLTPKHGATETNSVTPLEAELTRMVHALMDDNRSLRQVIGRMETTMETQGRLLNSLCDKETATTEAIRDLRKEVAALPGRLKISR